ncbi:DegT/DnrJ/EryC1/StrS family aminotransferase [Croceibacter atlanticus]|uniref:DegT/DnrJ/EryC1/StrS family aminotransferase n=1 Tax=Croceibacter atlanticus TaxID=313588 RepID=UPI0024BBAD4D|nr:DegT/DnrJ/EryC1/StrS family aminotransferase [Croceibacter atlanticus]
MVNVTKTFFPPLNLYKKQLERIWNNQWLTNRGELVNELEDKLKSYLNTTSILAMTNGTLPIQIALKILGNKGEIITTPFSYVATTSAIIWENCKPIFVDIHPEYLTIDERKIEAAITNKTTAILATHVFGNPCNLDIIKDIAHKHDLKIIYDAAHAFGVTYKGKSVFEYGDVSTCSFHATKLFHTGEGGALFCNDQDLMNKLYYSHNFGHDGPLNFHGLGINAKISELQAAMGLAVLPFMEDILKARKQIVDYYNHNLNFSKISKIKIREFTEWNFSYYPIIFNTEKELLKAQKLLNENEIFPRRYFYPSLNRINYVDAVEMPISESVSKRVLCLPLYKGLDYKYLKLIVKILNNV